MSKYTPWFPPAVKPFHSGVYETSGGLVFQHWNGQWWGKCEMSPAKAYALKDRPSLFQNDTWRGLAKKP